VLLVLVFTIKKRTKILGIIILVLGLITTVVTNFWGIIGLAFFIPAGIMTLKFKPGKRYRVVEEEEEPEQTEPKPEKKGKPLEGGSPSSSKAEVEE